MNETEPDLADIGLVTFCLPLEFLSWKVKMSALSCDFTGVVSKTLVVKRLNQGVKKPKAFVKLLHNFSLK